MLSVVGPFTVVLLQGLNTSNRGLSIASFKVRYLDFDDDFAVVVAAIIFFYIVYESHQQQSAFKNCVVACLRARGYITAY